METNLVSPFETLWDLMKIARTFYRTFEAHRKFLECCEYLNTGDRQAHSVIKRPNYVEMKIIILADTKQDKLRFLPKQLLVPI